LFAFKKYLEDSQNNTIELTIENETLLFKTASKLKLEKDQREMF